MKTKIVKVGTKIPRGECTVIGKTADITFYLLDNVKVTIQNLGTRTIYIQLK